MNSQIPVVVKFLALGGAVQWEELKLFEREAKVLEQLDSPRIPKYYDYFSVDDQKLWFALVQQYIPGVSLKQRLAQHQSFSAQQVRQIVREILELLQYLHTLNPPLLHRDLKPSNLLWGDDERVYLLDFGGVQVRPPNAGATFTVVGTYGYAPLEQYGGRAVPASDLYALGATAIHLLTGAAPSELMGEELRLQFRDRLGEGVDAQFIAWLERMTEPSAKKRFSSATEALEALKPQATVSYSRAGNSRRLARVSKSSQELTIEIPSRFEIEFMKPLGNWFGGVGSGVGGWIRAWRDRVASPVPSKKLPAVGLGALAVVGLLAGLSLFEVTTSAVGSILFWPLRLILPWGLLIWFLSTLCRGSYFERVHLRFNKETFEIRRKSSKRKNREKGEVAQIEEIYLSKWCDRAGKIRCCLAIATQTEGKIPFFSSKRGKEHLFGQQLSELELHGLAQEIQEWLNVVRRGKQS